MLALMHFSAQTKKMWMHVEIDTWLTLAYRIGLSVVFVILTIIVCQLLVQSVGRFARRFGLSMALVHAVQRLLRWAGVVVAGMLVLQAFDVLPNAWAALASILALVGIGFVAVWSVLSNTLCSIILMVSQPFQIGDRIRIPSENVEGTVIDTGLLYTTLESGADQLQVPNNLFFQKILVLLGKAGSPPPSKAAPVADTTPVAADQKP